MNEFFYIIGITFIPLIVILIFRSKEKVLQEQDDLRYCMGNPFETINFIRNNIAKVIVSLLFYLWVVIGIFASNQRLAFGLLISYGFAMSYITYFVEDRNKRYWAETIGYSIGVLIVSSIIYLHYYQA